MSAVVKESRFLSFDATPIFYRRLTPASPRGILIIVHGMGEHGGRYLDFASHAATRGFDVWIPDLRGFGLSGGKRGCLRRFSQHHGDAAALHAFAARTLPGLPVFFLGHSFGGLILSSYLAYEAKLPAAGLVLTSPNFGIAIPVPAWRHALGVVCAAIAPDYRQVTGVKAENLTHDKAILEVYAKDKLLFHQISASLYVEMKRMIDKTDDIAARLTLPTLVLQAGDDRIVSRPATERFFAKLASNDKQLEVYEGLFHEILNETSRPKVYERVLSWLASKLP